MFNSSWKYVKSEGKTALCIDGSVLASGTYYFAQNSPGTQ